MVQRWPGLGTSVKWEENVDRKEKLSRTPNVFRIPGENKRKVKEVQ